MRGFIPTNINFEEWATKIGAQESQKIRWGGHWKDSLVDRVKNGKKHEGELLPWSNTAEAFRVRLSELSVVGGYSGHRKSMWLGMVLLWLSQRQRVCIASMEMEPEVTLMRMATQAAGCTPSAAFVEKFAEWSVDRICIYDELDSVKPERVIGMVRYAAVELGCKHIAIDSLTKCGFGVDDLNGQKMFTDKLAGMAKSLGIHIWLVAHMRKTMDDTKMPSKFDVAGGADLTNLASNVIIVFKKAQMESVYRKVHAGQSLNPKEQELLEAGWPEQQIEVAKQRNHDWEGKLNFWLNRDSMQFLSYAGMKPFQLNVEPESKPQFDDGIPF